MRLRKWLVCLCVGHDPAPSGTLDDFAWQCRRCGRATREPRA
jgi:hypothetical protein